MNAVVLESQLQMSYRQVPTPEPRAGQVLLAVRAASICGSDLHRFTRGHKVMPLVLGHEAAGEVVAVGVGVDPALVGRHAALVPLVPCFACEQCRAGRYSACPHYSFIGSRQNGGYAERVEVPVGNLLLLPDELPFEAAALVEPSSVARHVLDLGAFQPGQSAVVLGAGSIGLMTVQWLRILGAAQIITSDLSEANRQAALELGASAALDPATVDVPKEVKALTGQGADLALETAGAPQTLQQAIKVIRPAGTVVCVGNQPPEATLPLSWIEELMRAEAHLRGCFMSYSAPFPGHEWRDSVEALRSGQLDWQAMISHRFPLSQAPEVFGQMAKRAFGYRKIILYPEK
jgi:L-iditol 2-dehydrogenase